MTYQGGGILKFVALPSVSRQFQISVAFAVQVRGAREEGGCVEGRLIVDCLSSNFVIATPPPPPGGEIDHCRFQGMIQSANAPQLPTTPTRIRPLLAGLEDEGGEPHEGRICAEGRRGTHPQVKLGKLRSCAAQAVLDMLAF